MANLHVLVPVRLLQSQIGSQVGSAANEDSLAAILEELDNPFKKEQVGAKVDQKCAEIQDLAKHAQRKLQEVEIDAKVRGRIECSCSHRVAYCHLSWTRLLLCIRTRTRNTQWQIGRCARTCTRHSARRLCAAFLCLSVHPC